jgi:hypothetical protein
LRQERSATDKFAKFLRRRGKCSIALKGIAASPGTSGEVKERMAMNYSGDRRMSDPQRRDEREAGAAIQVGVKAGPDAHEARWSFALTVFFRVLSILWIAEGLSQWLRILDPRILDPQAIQFLDHSNADICATIFFAVLDPVAAVGLWLIAPWGGVVWLLTLLAQVFVVSIKPAFFFGGSATKFLDGALLVAYLLISWRANIAAGETNAIDRLIAAFRAALRRR